MDQFPQEISVRNHTTNSFIIPNVGGKLISAVEEVGATEFMSAKLFAEGNFIRSRLCFSFTG